jgi:hypothetical protein
MTYPRFAREVALHVVGVVVAGLLFALGGTGFLDRIATWLFAFAVWETINAVAFAAWTWRNQRRHGVTLATRWELLRGAWLLARVALRAVPLRAVELATPPARPTSARDR